MVAISNESKPRVTAVLSRICFAVYFAFAFWTVTEAGHQLFVSSKLTGVWLLYLVAIYLLGEFLYRLYWRRGIDLTFALPLGLATYLLTLVSLLLAGQERFPFVNRMEHFASFVLITFIIWVFFSKYLPHHVWRDHPYYTAVLVFSVTSTIGVVNELMELLFDTFFTTALVGSSLDTSLDLLMNTLGGMCFLGLRLLLVRVESEGKNSTTAT